MLNYKVIPLRYRVSHTFILIKHNTFADHPPPINLKVLFLNAGSFAWNIFLVYRFEPASRAA